MAGRPVPGALNIGDGGGKGEGRLLGCGIEKRPPYPRLSKLGGDAPRLGEGSFTLYDLDTFYPSLRGFTQENSPFINEGFKEVSY
jgi:hypothetical protein